MNLEAELRCWVIEAACATRSNLVSTDEILELLEKHEHPPNELTGELPDEFGPAFVELCKALSPRHSGCLSLDKRQSLAIGIAHMRRLLDNLGQGSWYTAHPIDEMVHELDVIMNGHGAAKQARLCDLMPELRKALTDASAPVDMEGLTDTQRDLVWRLVSQAKTAMDCARDAAAYYRAEQEHRAEQENES